MRDSSWLLIAAVLFIASLVLHQIPLLLISLLLFLIWGITRLWERYCLSRLEYRRKLSTNRVFFGEEIQLEVEVANRKPLPLPWIEIEDEVPEEVTLLKGTTSPSHRMSRVFLTNFLSLGWYHKVKRRYPLRCLQRGIFSFGPTFIRSGDLFGFFRREMEIPQEDYLTVYPRIVPLEKLRIPSKQPLGDIRTRRYIFQDPILTLGVRDYHFGDSLKQIHWKTTARLGKLQAKVFEPTTTIDMGIFLDIRTTKPPDWGTVAQLMELGIIAAASIADHAMSAGYRVGLYVNQRRGPAGESIRIPPSQHTDQMIHILEALAQIHTAMESQPMARFVVQESTNLPWGSTLVAITAVPTDALLSTLTKMKRAGRRVALISVGGTGLSVRKNGLPTYHIPDDVPWQDLESLNIKGE